MTKNEKLDILKYRLMKLQNNHRNVKSTGVIRKLKRQIKNYGGIVENSED
jgi:hypothetical protein